MKAIAVTATAALMMLAMCQAAGCSKKAGNAAAPAGQTAAGDTQGGQVHRPPFAHEGGAPRHPAGMQGTTSTAPSAEAMAAVAAQGARATAMANAPDMVEMRNRFGIEVTDVSIHGVAIDVQFTVSTPEKSGAVLSPAAERYLIDQKSGTKILSPTNPRVKRLRLASGVRSQNFIATFDNSKGVVKPGDQVSVVVDEYRVDNLEVR